jgi:hypothetical protein
MLVMKEGKPAVTFNKLFPRSSITLMKKTVKEYHKRMVIQNMDPVFIKCYRSSVLAHGRLLEEVLRRRL